MLDAAGIYQKAVLYDLWHYFGVGEAISAPCEPIVAILDSNEKINLRLPLKQPLSIFTHIAGASAEQDRKAFHGDLRALAEKWKAFTAPLDILMQTADGDFSGLAMPFESGDISLYEHSRILAAIMCTGTQDLILYSADLSGIQSFLYTIGNKGALKGLKARSFYLNLLMAHTSDTILEASGLSRLNLIYCGGGKAHMLLSADKLEKADQVIAETNRFLQQHFGTSLYIARGYAAASLEALSSWKGDMPCFADLFRQASAMISERKLRRYSAEELIAINKRREDPERECVICGTSSRLMERDGEYLCQDCLRFERFAGILTRMDLGFAVDESSAEPSLALPAGLSVCLADHARKPVRFYRVNPSHVQNGFPLYVGNYQPESEDPVTFEMLGNASEGIRRIGILRMDVDNLGSLFSSGFVAPESDKPYSRVSLVRYSMLSSAMTRFFQQKINETINAKASPALTEACPRSISIVYSGGDDLFLAGAWNDIADAALSIHDAFSAFSLGKASISGGIGLFGIKDPIRQMAAYCAELEDRAKQMPGKDAICLFDTMYAFPWKVYQSGVLGEMLPAVSRLCEQEAKGNSFLYHVMELLRDVANHQIAIARLAYLLARHRPRQNGAQYDALSRSIYQWALEPDRNLQLQTAIQIYIYLHREAQEP